MSSPATLPNQAPPQKKSLRVLYADDMLELRSLVKNMLGRDGHSVEGVADGSLALKKIKEDLLAFNVVITDHHMPIMDGLELVKRLRQIGYPGRILVFSSELSPEVAAEYENLKVDGLLPKPVHPSILREIVGKF